MRPADRFDVVIFDADDTLWRSEDYFRETASMFDELVSPYAADGIDATEVLHRIEVANVATTGYGAMAYTLSMVEAATEASAGEVPADVLAELVRRGYQLLQHPVELLPGVEEVLDDVGASHRLKLITKGDLLHQTNKIAQSGVADRFAATLVVAEKDTTTYADAFAAWQLDPSRVLMVGNSMRSDVLPVVELGGFGVHIPYHTTWAHEAVEPPIGLDGFAVHDSISEFARWFRSAVLR